MKKQNTFACTDVQVSFLSEDICGDKPTVYIGTVRHLECDIHAQSITHTKFNKSPLPSKIISKSLKNVAKHGSIFRLRILWIGVESCCTLSGNFNG